MEIDDAFEVGLSSTLDAILQEANSLIAKDASHPGSGQAVQVGRFLSFRKKFCATEGLTRLAISSALWHLEYLGFHSALISRESTCSILRFTAARSCRAAGEGVVESSRWIKKAKTSWILWGAEVQEKIVTRKKVYLWECSTKMSLQYIGHLNRQSDQGADDSCPDKRGGEVLAREWEVTTVLTTDEPSPPFAETSITDPIEVNISWLVQWMSSRESGSVFKICLNDMCRTPTRNESVQSAQEFFVRFNLWLQEVESYMKALSSEMRPGWSTAEEKNSQEPEKCSNQEHVAEVAMSLDMLRLLEDVDDVLCPVVPYILKMVGSVDECNLRHSRIGVSAVDAGEGRELAQKEEGEGEDIALKIENALVENGASSLGEKLYRNSVSLACMKREQEQRQVQRHIHNTVVLSTMRKVIHQYFQGLQFMERNLKRDLEAVLGSRITSAQHDTFMHDHIAPSYIRQLYQDSVQPYGTYQAADDSVVYKSFSHSVRRERGMHSSEGTVSLVQEYDASNEDVTVRELRTLQRSWKLGSDHFFMLGAATKVQMAGQVTIHGTLLHQFSDPSPSLSLRCRSKYFSTYIVLLGNVLSDTEFRFRHGLVVGSREEVNIPLSLEIIPSAKEFKESILSLSQTQKDFAEAYRSMQLSGTMFVVCTVPVQPLLEQLLCIPYGSLCAEVLLTRTLLRCLGEYNVPSDLLANTEGGCYLTEGEALCAVRRNSEKIIAVFDKEIWKHEEKVRKKMERRRERERRRLAKNLAKQEAERVRLQKEREEKERHQQQRVNRKKCRELLKIVVIGDSKVGKTSFLRRFTQGSFTEEYRPTIGAEFTSREMVVDSVPDRMYLLQLWEVQYAGEFGVLYPAFCRGADAILFGYDISRQSTLNFVEEEIENTMEIVTRYRKVPFYLIGCKSDLKETSSDLITGLVEKYELTYRETSAKTGSGVESLFHDIVTDVDQRRVQGNYYAPLRLLCMEEPKSGFLGPSGPSLFSPFFSSSSSSSKRNAATVSSSSRVAPPAAHHSKRPEASAAACLSASNGAGAALPPSHQSSATEKAGPSSSTSPSEPPPSPPPAADGDAAGALSSSATSEKPESSRSSAEAPSTAEDTTNTLSSLSQTNRFETSTLPIASLPSALDKELLRLEEAGGPVTRPVIMTADTKWRRRGREERSSRREHSAKVDKDGNGRRTGSFAAGACKLSNKTSEEEEVKSEMGELLDTTSQRREKEIAMDLIDSLTRSGEIPLSGAQVHVILPICQVFAETVMGALVRDSRDLIAGVEDGLGALHSILSR